MRLCCSSFLRKIVGTTAYSVYFAAGEVLEGVLPYREKPIANRLSCYELSTKNKFPQIHHSQSLAQGKQSLMSPDKINISGICKLTQSESARMIENLNSLRHHQQADNYDARYFQVTGYFSEPPGMSALRLNLNVGET